MNQRIFMNPFPEQHSPSSVLTTSEISLSKTTGHCIKKKNKVLFKKQMFFREAEDVKESICCKS